MEKANLIQNLRDSFTFQMSLGSKELFHTNFLEWLSFIDWNGFISLMHTMAEPKNGKFWWEDSYSPVKENVEVRREFNHYDLSIYVKIGEKWCPVLILENKVKSMPYHEQLDRYSEKAYKEWKSCLLPRIRNKVRIEETRKEKGISFVLLTLFDENIDLPDSWKIFKYGTLKSKLDCISEKIKDPKQNLIINDYCKFIEALYKLANTHDWKVKSKDSYVRKIINDRKEESELRIADLREKIIHERMLSILIEKIENKDIFIGKHMRWDKNKEFIDKDKKVYNTGVVFYQTSFSRGKGITEAFVIINENYRLMIQLQHNEYRRCLILHDTNNESAEQREARKNNIVKKLKDKLWPGFIPSRSFGDCFKYACVPIDDNYVYDKYAYVLIDDRIDDKTVDNVLEEMVQDLSYIMKRFNDLNTI
jgi:hypothetical protein